MSVTIELPVGIERQLIEAYCAERLSVGQVAQTLGLSVIETESLLKEKGVDLLYTLEDLEADRAATKKVLGVMDHRRELRKSFESRL